MLDLWQTTLASTIDPLVNYLPTKRQWEIQNSMFQRPVLCFVPNFLRAQNMVQVIKGKII